jgi:hypothetical protein
LNIRVFFREADAQDWLDSVRNQDGK